MYMRFKRGLKYIALVLLVLVLGFLYSFSSTRNSNKIVENVVVEFESNGSNFLTHSMVNKLLIQNGKGLKNQAKSVINLYNLEKAIGMNPYIENSSVFLGINGTLKTVITQRTPVARVINVSTSYYIDKNGVTVPLSDIYSERVLLISGVKKSADVREILPLISFILDDSFLQKEVVGIERFANEEYQISVRSGNYKIDFGKLTNMDVKFKKLKAFYNTTFEDKTIHKYKNINVKYHNQVVCTK
jgi:cell division protein FtsQ